MRREILTEGYSNKKQISVIFIEPSYLANHQDYKEIIVRLPVRRA